MNKTTVVLVLAAMLAFGMASACSDGGLGLHHVKGKILVHSNSIEHKHAGFSSIQHPNSHRYLSHTFTSDRLREA